MLLFYLEKKSGIFRGHTHIKFWRVTIINQLILAQHQMIAESFLNFPTFLSFYFEISFSATDKFIMKK